MAKSNEQRLREAIAAGDLEAARKLVGKALPAKPRAPRRPRAKAAAPQPPPPPTPEDRLRPDGVIDIADLRGGRARAAGAPSVDGSSIFVMGEDRGPGRRVEKDGRVRVEARRESMAAAPPVIKPLKDDGRGGYESPLRASLEKIDKRNARKAAELPRRPPQQKVRCTCDGCRREFVVYMSELQVRTDEDMSSDYFYVCSKCCRYGRGL